MKDLKTRKFSPFHTWRSYRLQSFSVLSSARSCRKSSEAPDGSSYQETEPAAISLIQSFDLSWIMYEYQCNHISQLLKWYVEGELTYKLKILPRILHISGFGNFTHYGRFWTEYKQYSYLYLFILDVQTDRQIAWQVKKRKVALVCQHGDVQVSMRDVIG